MTKFCMSMPSTFFERTSAAVEERQAGCHEQYQRCAGQDPGGRAGVHRLEVERHCSSSPLKRGWRNRDSALFPGQVPSVSDRELDRPARRRPCFAATGGRRRRPPGRHQPSRPPRRLPCRRPGLAARLTAAGRRCPDPGASTRRGSQAAFAAAKRRVVGGRSGRPSRPGSAAPSRPGSACRRRRGRARTARGCPPAAAAALGRRHRRAQDREQEADRLGRHLDERRPDQPRPERVEQHRPLPGVGEGQVGERAGDDVRRRAGRQEQVDPRVRQEPDADLT